MPGRAEKLLATSDLGGGGGRNELAKKIEYVLACKCRCCGSILSLVQILFFFVLKSLSYITIPKNKGK